MTIRSQDGAFTRYLLPTVSPTVLFNRFAAFVFSEIMLCANLVCLLRLLFLLHFAAI